MTDCESLKESFFAYYKLKPQYKCISTFVVGVGGVLGFYFWIGVARAMRISLDIPIQGGSLDGLQKQFAIWIGGAILTLPLLLVSSVMLVGTVIGLALGVAGKISFMDAWRFGLQGKFPQSWLSVPE